MSETDWVLVPREPTDEMQHAGQRYALFRTEARAVYEAMLASAPSAPQGGWVERTAEAAHAFRAGMRAALAAQPRTDATAKDAEIEALRAKVERLQAEIDNRWATGVHTCHENCQRTACVLRRDNERLAEALRGIRRDALDGCSAMDCARDAFDVLNELALLREQEEGRHG